MIKRMKGKRAGARREYDFALVISGVRTLTREVEDALFEAGCDDATLSMRYGFLYAEFSRSAKTLQEALMSAIHDVRRAGVGAEILRVDEATLVTQAEMARRIGRSRQLVGQYISGARGGGNFPPPECHLGDESPLWSWWAVSEWLVGHEILRPEEGVNAEVVLAVNTLLESSRQRRRNRRLVEQIESSLSQN